MANKNYPKSLSFSTTIPFDQPLSYMPQQTITGAVTFGKQTSNSQVGFGCLVRLVADGSHAPDLSGFALEGPGVWVNTNGTVNKLFFYYDGSQYCVIITQPGSGGTVTDVTPPNLVSATATDGSHISVVFDEAVNVTTLGWGVYVAETGITHSLTSVSGSGANWTFVVGGTALLSGQTLGLIYTAASGNTLDTAGNELSDVSNFPVTNSIGGADTTAPTLVTATAIDATHVRLVFSEAVVATVAGWTLHDMTSITNYTFTSITGSGTTWDMLVASGTITAGHTLTIDYATSTGNTLDLAGNELAGIIGQGVINSVGGGSYDTDAQAIIDAKTTAGVSWNTTKQDAVNAFVTGLKTDGLWTKTRQMGNLSDGTFAKCKINWKSPGTKDLASTHGTITYGANGAAGDASTGYIDTGIDPLTEYGVSNIVAAAAIYCRTAGSTSVTFDFGGGTPSPNTQKVLTAGWGTARGVIAADQQVNAVTDSQGFFTISRRSVTDEELYKNGVSVGTNTTDITGGDTQPDLNMYLLAYNDNGAASLFSDRELSFWWTGDGLSDTDAANLNTRFQALKTAFGW